MKFKQKFVACAVVSAMSVNAMPLVSFADEINLAGKDRFDTANRIAKGYYGDVDKVILVNAKAVPDALAVTPLAHKYKAPILLTNRDGLTKETENIIKNKKVKEIVLIGGSGSISNELEKDLAKTYKVERIGGKNRTETSINIAKKLGDSHKMMFVVNGFDGLPDAVSAGPVAAKYGAPIVLIGKDEASSKMVLKQFKYNNLYLVGGEQNISEGVRGNGERLAGKDRRDTNAKVIEKFYGKEIPTVFVAKDGSNNLDELIDSLAIGPVSAKENIPLVIASVTKGLNKSQLDLLKKHETKKAIGVGGGLQVPGKQILAADKNIDVRIDGVKKDDKNDNTSSSSSSSSSHRGSGGSSTVDNKKELEKNVENKLDGLVNKVGSNNALKDIAKMSFDKTKDEVTVEITKKPKQEDFAKLADGIKDTGFISGLKDISEVESYTVIGKDGKELTKRVPKDLNEAKLKEYILNDILGPDNGALSDVDSLEKLNEKVVKVKTKLKDKKAEVDKEYKFVFKVNQNVLDEIAKEKAEAETNLVKRVDDQLAQGISEISNVEQVKNMAKIAFDKDSSTTTITVNEDLDFSKIKTDELLKIADTGFINKLQNIDGLIGYAIINEDQPREYRQIKGANPADLKKAIIQDVHDALGVSGMNGIEDLKGKSVKVRAFMEKDGASAQKDYTFNFDVGQKKN